MRVWCSDACRKRAARRTPPRGLPQRSSVPLVEPSTFEPGTVGVVESVKALLGGLDATNASAVAQAELAVNLAAMVEAGSVPAARELRQLLVDMRVSRDAEFEGSVTQALYLEVLGVVFSADLTPASPDEVAGAGADTPPGWSSTALDGELLEWLGRRWRQLDASGDVAGLRALDRWVGRHAVELNCIRRSGRWSVWGDPRDRLLEEGW